VQLPEVFSVKRYTVSMSEASAAWIDEAVNNSGMSRSELVDLAIRKLAARQQGYAKRRARIVPVRQKSS
jgi:metal-responsive CopG/Arc/MetJ family transcriptional regulator